MTIAEQVSAFERMISADTPDLTAARVALVAILAPPSRDRGKVADVEEALQLAAANATDPAVGAVVVRAAAIRDLLPETVAGNRVKRHVVVISERLHPEFLAFQKVEKNAQTFEKYLALESFHGRVLGLLSSLDLEYGDLDALLAGQREILGALSHSVIRSYCGPFHLKEVRSSLETAFGKVRQVRTLGDTLLRDVEQCYSTLFDIRLEMERLDSFLVTIFRRFLVRLERTLEAFLSSQRSKFTANIAWGSPAPTAIQKRYPLSQPGRETTIVVPLRNSGQGLAVNVSVSATVGSEDVVLGTEYANLGNIAPGGFSVSFQIMVIRPASGFELMLDISWGEISSVERKATTFAFTVPAQRADLDWDKWAHRNPYNTDIAEGDEFFGRVDLVNQLSAKLLSRPMESFYITGQKRVGKTSLALAAVTKALEGVGEQNLKQIYLLWGRVAHADPTESLRNLGRQIDRQVRSALPFRSTSDPDLYKGSLSGLIDLFDQAAEAIPETKFAVLIDEFDEIHPELFLQGNLAETFFANLRALSRCKNVCLILVGGENMPFVMDRQGQKLNNLARIDLSYFSRATEWADYQLMVRKPAEELLSWQEDAISELFNLTNGNPYFTKLVAAAVLKQALGERDADLTANEVHAAAIRDLGAIGTNSFAHLWQDGVPRRPDEREPEIMRRLRALAAIARCVRRGLPTTTANILDSRPVQSAAVSELPPVLDDFVRRKVLLEMETGYSFALPIFRMWLADVGLSHLISNSLGDDLATEIIEKENKAVVTAAEVASLAKGWPTYRGRVIGSEDIRAWMEQVDNIFDQRILFNLLSRSLVVGEPFIRERLKTAHSIIRRSLPWIHVTRERNERRKDLVVTYVDGEGKSGAYYAGLYAEENGIWNEAIISPSDFSSRLTAYTKSNSQNVQGIVVIDDVAATGRSLSTNLTEFVQNNREVIGGTPLRVVTLFSTAMADGEVNATLSKLALRDAQYRTCEILPDRHFAFPTSTRVWSTVAEEVRAKALVTDIGTTIYPTNPLGFGGLGLLLVLPTTVPNNTLPILHTPSRSGTNRGWQPLFPRIVN